SLTDKGIEKVEGMLGMKDIYSEGGIMFVHHLEQALKAEILFKGDKDYVVKDGEVVIVDEFTGRMMPGRRFSEGLHQAIEAKENVKVQKESKTLATITFQNYFRIYSKLAGMTGTAVTNAEEFSKVYDLSVIIIPSNKPITRKDNVDSIYKTERGKFTALIREIKKRHKNGQPVLVGTIAIDKSELLSEMLKKEGIPHSVLNAKFHEKEALIISNAGQASAVTIATNMAGRGTDIKLGEGVEKKGGLCIFGTERHEARRIDNQLRGRSGRQGELGETRFFVSMEDHVMRVFGSDKMKMVMDKLGIDEDMPIENSFISKSIENAQGKIEGYNFDIRKHVLDYDDVMNRQREVIYKKRREILDITKNIEKGEKEINKDNFPELLKLKDKILEMFENQSQYIVSVHSAENRSAWDVRGMLEAVRKIIPTSSDFENKIKEIISLDKPDEEARSLATELIFGALSGAYNKREDEIGYEAIRQIEKMVILRSVDMLWMEHLDSMDRLRDGISLQGYGQKDPLVEYKKESYRMFQTLLGSIEENVLSAIFKIQVVKKVESPMENKNISTSGGGEESNASVPETVKKIGRNDPCPCGSGKKYKKCCGA
ncbi:SEC-C domain-containing protein, partial [Candidatus Parcubacteria bacterium]|nr:SEC-C domain-containing protein [Candidatus Parcubacteria bacterium]